MGLNIKNPKIESLVKEVAGLMEEKKRLLSSRVTQTDRHTKFKNLLEQEIWPRIPNAQMGKRLTRKEEDKILGYGGR